MSLAAVQQLAYSQRLMTTSATNAAALLPTNDFMVTIDPVSWGESCTSKHGAAASRKCIKTGQRLCLTKISDCLQVHGSLLQDPDRLWMSATIGRFPPDSAPFLWQDNTNILNSQCIS